MRNLLNIETEFLTRAEIGAGLQLESVKTSLNALEGVERTKLAKTLELAKIMGEVKTYFELDETRAKFNDAGISWTIEELADKIFHCSKSWFHRCIKASVISATKQTKFISLCKWALESENLNVKCSIDNLNKFDGTGNTYTKRNFLLVFNPVETNENSAQSVVGDTPQTPVNTSNSGAMGSNSQNSENSAPNRSLHTALNVRDAQTVARVLMEDFNFSQHELIDFTNNIQNAIQ
tara:strand:- start:967 stop:1671 length:705 start_codon:yes stop_codon:yes gene_type:complete